MSDVTRFLISKEKVTIEDVAYYKLAFFDQMEGEVIEVMAPIKPDVIWVKPRPVSEDAQKVMEAKIRKQTEVTLDTGNIGDL